MSRLASYSALGALEAKGGAKPLGGSFFFRCFAWFAGQSLSRQFHSLRITRSSHHFDPFGKPLVYFVNHSSWWDPMVGLCLVHRFLPGRKVAVPMDQRALDKYRFFKKLGFFGVELGTLRGAKSFHREAARVLGDPEALLLITPQGRFVDVRERPPRFEAGLGHLGVLKTEAVFQPVAIEYAFWEEKRPEVLVHLGPVVSVPRTVSNRECSALFEAALAEAQDHLASLSIARNAAAFQRVLRGHTSVHPAYDLWRAVRSWFGGRSFNPAHSDK